MEHVVVVGAGLAGVMTAYELRRKLGTAHRVSVINKGSRFFFVPSAPWVAAGWREESDVTVDLSEPFKRHDIELFTQGARRADPVYCRVELHDGTFVDYDYLVLATGAEPAFDEIEGLGPGIGHNHSICGLDDAARTRAAIDALIAGPGPVVVGAAQGSPCLGPAYEFVLVLDKALGRAGVRDRAEITFVTPEPFAGHFGLGGVGNTRGLIEQEFESRGIAWICDARIDGIRDGKMAVSRMKDAATVGTAVELPFAFSMIMPPFRGVPAVQGIGGLTDTRGFVLVDGFMRNRTFPDVFAAGACVGFPSTDATPSPVAVQTTGFMIQSMAMATAHNIHRLIDEDIPDAAMNWNTVFLTDFGDRGIAFAARSETPQNRSDWATAGSWVHPAKVAFERYFLHKIRSGAPDRLLESLPLQMLGIDELAAARFTASSE